MVTRAMVKMAVWSMMASPGSAATIVDGELLDWNGHAGHHLLRAVALRYNAPMKVISLQSGSNGNCIYVEADGVRLLFDAGISGIQVQARLAIHDRVAEAIDAVLISHDHIDHSRSMGTLHRKFGLPIYATPQTYGFASILSHRRLQIKDEGGARGQMSSVSPKGVEKAKMPSEG